MVSLSTSESREVCLVEGSTPVNRTVSACSRVLQAELTRMVVGFLREDSEDCRVDISRQDLTLVEVSDVRIGEALLKVGDFLIDSVPLNRAGLLHRERFQIVVKILGLFGHVAEAFFLA